MLEVPESVIGHQDKAHGMAVDKDDNVWITDNGQATVMKLSPDGKLLMTIGIKGKRAIGWKQEPASVVAAGDGGFRTEWRSLHRRRPCQ